LPLTDPELLTPFLTGVEALKRYLSASAGLRVEGIAGSTVVFEREPGPDSYQELRLTPPSMRATSYFAGGHDPLRRGVFETSDPDVQQALESAPSFPREFWLEVPA
jgi:hypothetical protein